MPVLPGSPSHLPVLQLTLVPIVFGESFFDDGFLHDPVSILHPFTIFKWFLYTLYSHTKLHAMLPLHVFIYIHAYTTGNEEFKDVAAIIYCGLTDDECLHLAARHNINGHFTHAVTHRDYVSKA